MVEAENPAQLALERARLQLRQGNVPDRAIETEFIVSINGQFIIVDD